MMEESQALYQEWNPSDEGYRQKAADLAQDLHSVTNRLTSTLAAVVVHIGESFNPEQDINHKNKAERYKVGVPFEKPTMQNNRSKYYRCYLITNNDELIATNEYSCMLANRKFVHVIQVDDCIHGQVQDWRREKFNELVLLDRRGRPKQVYINTDKSLKQLLALVRSVKSDVSNSVLQLPYHMQSINLRMVQWLNRDNEKYLQGNMQQLMLDERTPTDFQLLLQD